MLDGHTLCEEARRYVANFLSVHRVRPQDEASEDGNSENIVSDEEGHSLRLGRRLRRTLACLTRGASSARNEWKNNRKKLNHSTVECVFGGVDVEVSVLDV